MERAERKRTPSRYLKPGLSDAWAPDSRLAFLLETDDEESSSHEDRDHGHGSSGNTSKVFYYLRTMLQTLCHPTCILQSHVTSLRVISVPDIVLIRCCAMRLDIMCDGC